MTSSWVAQSRVPPGVSQRKPLQFASVKDDRRKETCMYDGSYHVSGCGKWDVIKFACMEFPTTRQKVVSGNTRSRSMYDTRRKLLPNRKCPSVYISVYFSSNILVSGSTPKCFE